ncbi:N-acetyltransferase [Paenibacillus polysaccharolyticus]|jgi:amino-acid N-acetyltransferase|uniref:N-acetyltransferase n=3 Tax=Paenibacillus TaxID=44249 RepID=A0A5M9WMC1_PAEAM|nr:MULTISPECIES: N-acetyltransferase [Paenibacillus]MDP9699344.1 amino-acid N-acetyltransferase [Paenibacillus intestini]KAA8782722.1 N-acetyltransferase [Paenibacillus amylolyticus]MBY0204277.1 N-acetyltransferase [Paenibacillus cucumis (ex Kampfer et al. 2016)]MCP1132605.1 N-acetyltransferase [Paenibacillus polysaccharolyticus]MDT0124094.1 N-acetyltransferase [Paenibacillus sp. RRE4]
MSVICRKAVPEDVEPLFEMIKGYAERGIMLPRSREVLHRQLEHFIVAEVDGVVVGCGSLCRLGNDLVEVRSLGISEGYKGLGIGSRLLDRLVEEAERQQIPKVMALTYEVSFFLKNGFAVVEKEIFPEKVWTDCVHCSKQDCCDEIAVLKELNVSA